MKEAGQIVLTPFPHADLSGSKLRPVLLLRRASNRYDDWLVCMISSQLRQAESGLDEIITPEDGDFQETGLKVSSVLRLSRLAVLDGALMAGTLGAVDGERLERVRRRLGKWVANEL